MGKKKKFIDKKSAVTFHLVHRSQKDPLQADEEAPQRVLQDVKPSNEKDKTKARKEEQTKYGVFFEDDYDYMQHLKDVDELNEVEPLTSFRLEPSVSSRSAKGPTLKLPSSVFSSELETEVGILNKAAPSGPKIDWDPDIVAGLDDDFDYDDPDNQLEDDFMGAANADGPVDLGDEPKEGATTSTEGVNFWSERLGIPKPQVDIDEDDDEGCRSDEADMSDGGDDDNTSDLGSLGDPMFMEEETKTRFTSYSMTSSVIRRNEGLSLLDDRFEKLYEQYDDDEIGALDHEDIDGYLQGDNPVLDSALAEFAKQQAEIKLKDSVEKVTDIDIASDSGSESGEEDLVKMVVEEPKEKWDCESILSTYSTLYNHPTKIVEPSKKNSKIELTKRAGIPVDVLPEKGPTRRQLEEEDTDAFRGDRASTYRPRGETTEERRARKKDVKDERKTRREEKKMNKMAFKEEHKRQHKDIMNMQKNANTVNIV